ncbi:hypothetical protein [Enterobacter hormaechei]
MNKHIDISNIEEDRNEMLREWCRFLVEMEYTREDLILNRDFIGYEVAEDISNRLK